MNYLKLYVYHDHALPVEVSETSVSYCCPQLAPLQVSRIVEVKSQSDVQHSSDARDVTTWVWTFDAVGEGEFLDLLERVRRFERTLAQDYKLKPQLAIWRPVPWARDLRVVGSRTFAEAEAA